MNLIEETFKAKSQNDFSAKKFLAQWELLSNTLPEILQAISQYFPHYSLHDKTHSERILNNICMVIGEESIKKLSVVDLWLLLMSAYCHDLGMVVFSDDICELLNYKDNGKSSEFVNFVENHIHNEKSPLHKYAETYEVKEGKIYYKDNLLSTQSIDAHRFLIAGFLRGIHADRSSYFLKDRDIFHMSENGIPKRIIKLLADICLDHQKNRDDLLKLPKEEYSVCGTENCHPLFVGCMLRLGDLLDIDTNRVSTVLLNTLPSIPVDSQCYCQSNRDITHLLINKSVIEISAECDDVKVLKILEDWFNMINEEVSFQTREWYRISPSEDFAALPSVGFLRLKLKGYDEYDGKIRNRFEIDLSSAFNLFQGSGLYDSPFHCIKELLQNSEDATILRIFKECHDIGEGEKGRKYFYGECEKYPIEIKLRRILPENANDDFYYCNIVVRDQGIGMGYEDLKYLTHIGTSSQNKEKQDMVKSMPYWMRPSGVFGMGFQSVFLLTDKVLLKTRKWGCEDVIELELYHPLKNRSGLVLKKETYKDSSFKIGTSVEFDIKLKKEPKRVSFYNVDYIAQQIFNSYDFACDNVMEVEYGRILDTICRFGKSSYSRLNLYLDDGNQLLQQRTRNDWKLLDSTEMEVQMDYSDPTPKIYVYYRGQQITSYSPGIPTFFTFNVNILSGTAKDYLTVDRKRINSDSEEIVRENIAKSIILFLDEIYDTLDDPQKPKAAAMIKWYESLYMLQEWQSKDDWKRININGRKDCSVKSERKTIGDLIECDEVEFSNDCKLLNFKFSEINNSFIVSWNPDCDSEFFFLLYMLKYYYTQIVYKDNCLHLTKIKSQPQITFSLSETEAAKIRLMEEYLNNGKNARDMCYCEPKYKKLMSVDGAKHHRIYNQLKYLWLEYDFMVSPYKRINNQCVDGVNCSSKKLEYSVDDTLINYVYKHRVDENVTKEEIRALYDEYKKEYDPIVEIINKRQCHNKQGVFGNRG